ncbi:MULTISPECIES: YwqI/YxiC family protein [Virgibacillus]|uniref:YwqI/YxiC family protein n=1 Tax=Virgibacillus massiliensis TaxID=1462526 RepID=A0A024QF81_9BACI|nr:YwqI/YxiC family protein [Virgibacillus massiliensis]CDQ41149.1 hypothetical protein BN990_03504 [Virgibacillus massiliensis]
MSKEIKLQQEPVIQALTNLKTATESMDATGLGKEIEGNNTLDMVTKINEINHQLEDILTTYQTILLNHEQETAKAVDNFMQTEQMIASSMELSK